MLAFRWVTSAGSFQDSGKTQARLRQDSIPASIRSIKEFNHRLGNSRQESPTKFRKNTGNAFDFLKVNFVLCQLSVVSVLLPCSQNGPSASLKHDIWVAGFARIQTRINRLLWHWILNCCQSSFTLCSLQSLILTDHQQFIFKPRRKRSGPQRVLR